MSVKNDVFSALAGMESHPGDDIEVIDGVVCGEELAVAILDKDYAEAATLIVEAEVDLNKVENKIEYLEDTLEELQEEVAGLEAMASGTNTFNAALAHDKYQRAAKIAARLNVNVEVQGTESFTSKDAMLGMAGIESMKDTLKKGAEAAIKFLKELFESLSAFVTSVFGRTAAAEKKLKALQGSNLELKEGDVKLPAVANWVGENADTVNFGMFGSMVNSKAESLIHDENPGKELNNLFTGKGFRQDGDFVTVANAKFKINDKFGPHAFATSEAQTVKADSLNMSKIKANIQTSISELKKITGNAGADSKKIKKLGEDFVKSLGEVEEGNNVVSKVRENAKIIGSYIRGTATLINYIVTGQIAYIQAVTK